MPSDLSNYLATRYLVADPKPSKKRKRKPDASAGLVIADDDDSSWARASRARDNDEDAAVVAGTSADFRKSKKSTWKVIGGASTSQTSGTSASAADLDSAQRADAILASAAAEASSAQASATADEAPTVLMSDGTHAGLQTASAVSAQLAARREAERKAYASGAQAEAETVYRDATGRRVDVSLKRAELRRAAQEAAAAEQAKKEALKGDVQVEAARQRREQLEDAKVMAVARHADDLDLNREMKEQVRWGDTMAQFIEPRGGGGGGGGGGGASSGGAKKRIKGKPVYQGAWAPNRYGIKPGYRWDGVDRGNGFEAERFKAINRRERNKGLEYSWQMDE